MQLSQRSISATLAVGVCVAATACKTKDSAGSDANPPASPGSSQGGAATMLPDEGPLPRLRTGTREMTTLPEATGAIEGHQRDGADFYVVTLDALEGQMVARVHISEPPHAVGGLDERPNRMVVRVPASAGGAVTLRGTVFLQDNAAGHTTVRALPFVASGARNDDATLDLPTRWTRAFAAELRGTREVWSPAPLHPWRAFAAGRVAVAMGGSEAPGEVRLGELAPRRTELSELMYTTVAATSMQEALQHDRGLRLADAPQPATVPIAELSTPELVEHPWPAMMRALPPSAEAVPEPLAAATPADFWYVRFDDIRVLLRVLDEASAWITPVAHIMEERAEVHALSERYQRQLGLRRTGLAKALGHTVIDRVAIVGSDPYLREGSDVTFIFEVGNDALFDRELAAHMKAYRAEVPGIAASTSVHRGHTITVNRDPAGRVRQYRARVGDRSVVSNSAAACRAVLDAIDGQRPRLSDEQDLAYMLARDPGEHDGFAFLSDRFIAAVVGPRQKVLAARRQQALSELLTPGYAALLYGWLQGSTPSTTQDLLDARLLARDELTHRDGSPIVFEPGATARSRWGTPAALTPLIDLPAPTLVTADEQAAYGRFASGYQDYWRDFIDPIAVRMDLDDGDTARAVIDVRVLPLIAGSDYGDLEEIVGTERIAAPAITDGLQMVWAVGEDSELRRELDRAAGALSGSRGLGLEWLGDWVTVGTLDRRPIVELLSAVEEDIQLPASPSDRSNHDLEMARLLGRLPLYAAAHVRNPTGLVATLAALRVTAGQVAPGVVTWEEHSKHGDVPIVRVGVDPSADAKLGAFADALALFYAQPGDAFVVALDEAVLEQVIDRFAAGEGPRRGVATGPQFVVDARLAKGHASFTAAAWALQGQANRTQAAARSAAEILLRGDPSIDTPEGLVHLGMAYFGSYPVTASGEHDFRMTPHGVADPVHGSVLEPSFPELPVAGSAIAGLMDRLVAARAEISFDREPAKMDPPARSLHTRFEVQLGATAE
ncbi:MAG: hypothetical protein AAF721_13805 [Myxococcota bacterium]